MKTPLTFTITFIAALILCAASSPAAETTAPLFATADLAIGDQVSLTLPGGTPCDVRLVAVKEHRGEVWGEISRAEVTVEVNGERKTIVSGMYQLPVPVGGVQVDSPITGGLKSNSHINHWQLEKDARLRIWPEGSPWIRPGTFVYPAGQKWFASQTSFSNEPVAPRPNGQLYYHAGLDIGGAEGLTEVVAATGGTVVSLGTEILTGHLLGTPVNPRYDVIYLIDSRGWYYRYSHFHSFDESVTLGGKVRMGQRLGLIGKEGGSGGWTHLHFEIKSRQPSGRWGTQEGYAFLWQSYLGQHEPEILAVARPGHVVFAGQSVEFDGRKSWSASGGIESFRWTFSDGTTANGPVARRTFDRPGTYFATLEVRDAEGRAAWDFARAKVFDREHPDRQPPRLHLSYHPTFNLRPGTEITFKGRAFYNTHGREVWDLGDGSPPVETKSDGNVKTHAPDGYAVVKYRYKKPGDYLVHVKRYDEHGHLSEDRLVVRIEEPR